MRETSSRLVPTLLALVFLTIPAAVDAAGSTHFPVVRQPEIAGTTANVLTSTGRPLGKNTSAADTFCLYGGPGSLEGKFQTAVGLPDFQGWIGVDHTDLSNYWQLSTFCASNLDGDGSSGGAGDGPGNVAYWCGQTAEQQPLWVAAPGYGNNWNEVIEWTATVDESGGPVAQTVQLSFAFNHESEAGYDFFTVQYDSAGVLIPLYTIAGESSFTAPGVQYPAEVPAAPIQFTGGDYGGPNGDQIRLLFRFTSDGGWSDEGGILPTDCGAVQVDDVLVIYEDGSGTQSSFSDFDNSNHWTPLLPPFVGDFSALYGGITDLDPCRGADGYVVGFLDVGQCPRNGRNNFGQTPCQVATPGGLTVFNVNYGVPGSFVVNYTGGLTNNQLDLNNGVWSPEIEWDLPGPEDDGAFVVGAKLRFDVWRDLPPNNGMFYSWSVRSRDSAGVWTQLRNRNLVYWGDNPTEWQSREVDVSDLLALDRDRVQIELKVLDISQIFGPPILATPSPFYDNVALYKYEIGGPVITSRNRDLFQDSFPQSGQTDFSSLAGRQNAAIRLDMASDTHVSDTIIVPGDSIVCDVNALIPGSTITAVGMNYVIDQNPVFDDARDPIAGGTTMAGGVFGSRVMGTVVGQPTGTENRFFFDMPDGGNHQIPVPAGSRVFFPGDRLRYYLWATDDSGRSTTLPVNTSAFDLGQMMGATYDRRFTVRALPLVLDTAGDGPKILLINDVGFGDDEAALDLALRQSESMFESFDRYNVMDPGAFLSTGIGTPGAHGATANQLSRYEAIVYLGGSQSNGTLLAPGFFNYKGDDLGVLTSWFNQSGDRALAIFGDNVSSSILSDNPGSGPNFVQSILGVDVIDGDVRADIDNQLAPRVQPTISVPCFGQSYVAYGGCQNIQTFDNIDALPGAVRAHELLDLVGVPYSGTGRAGSVYWDRTVGVDRKQTVVFPYSFLSIRSNVNAGALPGGVSPRSRLLGDVLSYCFAQPLFGEPTDAPATAPFAKLSNAPNPFNPRTTFKLTLGVRDHASVHVYNLRGELVKVLQEGVLDAGAHDLIWDGRDDRGIGVASGVYVVKALTNGREINEKTVLLK